MKTKITLILILAFYTIPCLPQNKVKYNSYKNSREEYIATGQEMFLETLVDCETTDERIQKCSEEYKSNPSEVSKKLLLSSVAKINCTKAINFFEYVIASDTSEELRCDAIKYLGWVHAEQSTSFLVEHSQRNISDYEKASIGAALCVIGKYQEASTVLNSVCYTPDGKMCDKCVWSYFILGGRDAIDYFYFLFSFPEYELPAALKLAELGEYEKTYPVFVKALNSGEQQKMCTALFGLASIGDENSIQLIQKHASVKDPFIANEANFILNRMNEGKGENEK